ncbi:Maf family protein [Qipengyuania atrilutea]|uniref:dTTP/UTP pyrophosphatase n=1 Tax=Qipengyuania atrilutea TaxID=2744473 RepID=A0A850H8P1_9SPHN|nr:nucleoside triphosphate pyrophosphatase [Actirhodobacter atriluteus]NVD45635.1 septum formation protein Maf [Actirhodobacter atriluteus]
MATPTLVLASSSPRRRELLARIGVTPNRIASPDIDETPHEGEQPRVYAVRMAEEKARAVTRGESEIVIAGDTTVAPGRRILQQAEDAAMNADFLRLLSGRRHRVLSAVSVISPDGVQRTKLSETSVKFKVLHEDEIAAYVATGEGIGKAGGYAIQGAAEGLISWVQGSYSGVVGLPLFETRALLKAAGLTIG